MSAKSKTAILAIGDAVEPPMRRRRAVLSLVVFAAMAGLALGSARGPALAAEPSQPAAVTAYPGGTWEPGPAKYGAAVIDDLPVTMNDGVVLRASVAYPTDPATGQRATGQFPVVIEHTPYVTLGKPVVPNAFLTQHGYIYVVVRARGTGASGGDVAFFSDRDGQDGKAIVDWAAHRLDGSDGRIALLGCSYPGGLALADAAALGPNSPVKAIVAACVGMSQLNRESLMSAGLMTTGFWFYTANGPALWGNAPASVKFLDQFSKDVLAGGQRAYEGAFWKDAGSLQIADKVGRSGIPILFWSGWRDIVDLGAIRAYAALQNGYTNRPIDGPMVVGQPTTPRYQIIMGDWQHASGLDAGIYLEWLDTWLKGVDSGIQKTGTPMHLYEPGTNRWVNLSGYPAVADYTSWRLDAASALSAAGPQNAGGDTLKWGDPAQHGSKLDFTTPPLADGATLAGPISATIYASSSNTNLELIAQLFDDAPDGLATLVSKGAMLGSQRELDQAKSWTDARGAIVWPWPSLQRDDYLTPGEIYRFDIGLLPRQWAVNPGHRLRLELTTQAPADVCPPTGLPSSLGTDPCRLTAPQQATLPGGVYRIIYGPSWPSALHLPQTTWKAFAEARAGVPPTAWNENQRSFEKTEVTLPLDWGHEQSARDEVERD